MQNWIALENRDNEYVRFVCQYVSRVTRTTNKALRAHDYDDSMFNVGDAAAVEYLAFAFDYFYQVYQRVGCVDFPGVCDRIAYAVNVALD